MDAKHIWIIYDERAHAMGTDEAAVLATCESEDEARGYVKHDWPRAAVYVYDFNDHGEAVNERLAWEPLP